MDSLTQATLGAAVGIACLGNKTVIKASLAGAVIATIPDLDVVLLPFYDNLEKISVHRGYSHSIFFSLVVATLVSLILKRTKWFAEFGMSRLWFFTWLTLITHMILDAFTSFGTQLFLPFSDYRVSFDSISIVDPFYTIPLFIGVVISVFFFKRKSKFSHIPNLIGLSLSTLYLLFTLGNKRHIEQVFQSQLEEQEITHSKLLTVPVKIGNMTWYGVAKDDTHLHIGKYSELDNNQIAFDSFPINDDLLGGLDPELVDRMKWFAQGFYTVAKKDGKIRIYNMQCDMQGVRQYGKYVAPTAFYYEIIPLPDGTYTLTSGMHLTSQNE